MSNTFFANTNCSSYVLFPYAYKWGIAVVNVADSSSDNGKQAGGVTKGCFFKCVRVLSAAPYRQR